MPSNTNRAIAAFLADIKLEGNTDLALSKRETVIANVLDVMENSRPACDVLEWAEVLDLVERADAYEWPDYTNDDVSDQADDYINEIADAAVSVYNAERYEWAARHGKADYSECHYDTKQEPHEIIAAGWCTANADALRSVLPAICKVYADT